MIDEKELQKLTESLGGVVAPTSLSDDPKQMLKAIQNAALIRAGVGMLGQRRPGESGYDVASRVLTDVSKTAQGQLSTYAKLAAAQKTKGTSVAKEQRSIAKDALTAYDKLYYEKDELGNLARVKKSFQFGVGGEQDPVDLPNKELFKNKLFPLYLDNQNLFEYVEQKHLAAVREFKSRGTVNGIKVAKWDWDDTMNSFETSMLGR
jgi:hypothetical protein